MKIEFNIEYTNNQSEKVVAQLADLAKWEKETNKTVRDLPSAGIWDTLFVAYQALKRQNNPQATKPFDKWCESVETIDGKYDDPKVSKPVA